MHLPNESRVHGLGRLEDLERTAAGTQGLECPAKARTGFSESHRSRRAGSGQDARNDPEIYCCPSFPAENVIKLLIRCQIWRIGTPGCSRLAGDGIAGVARRHADTVTAQSLRFAASASAHLDTVSQYSRGSTAVIAVALVSH